MQRTNDHNRFAYRYGLKDVLDKLQTVCSDDCMPLQSVLIDSQSDEDSECYEDILSSEDETDADDISGEPCLPFAEVILPHSSDVEVIDDSGDVEVKTLQENTNDSFITTEGANIVKTGNPEKVKNKNDDIIIIDETDEDNDDDDQDDDYDDDDDEEEKEIDVESWSSEDFEISVPSIKQSAHNASEDMKMKKNRSDFHGSVSAISQINKNRNIISKNVLYEHNYKKSVSYNANGVDKVFRRQCSRGKEVRRKRRKLLQDNMGKAFAERERRKNLRDSFQHLVSQLPVPPVPNRLSQKTILGLATERIQELNLESVDLKQKHDSLKKKCKELLEYLDFLKNS